jgi:tRNA(Arg) A34 adenosine deaminase TadA
MKMEANNFMKTAVALAAKAGLGERSGGCFGAVVVCNNQVVGEGHNRVLTTHDPTHHAEIHAIRNACALLRTHDLSECEIYSSCEPCPMCAGAIMWARIPVVHFASTAQDAEVYGNFDDVHMHNTMGTKKKTYTAIHDVKAREDMLVIWKKYQKSNPVWY